MVLVCLLRRMVHYVNHGGLQPDLKGGLGGGQGKSSNSLQLFVRVAGRTEIRQDFAPELRRAQLVPHSCGLLTVCLIRSVGLFAAYNAAYSMGLV